MILISTNTLRLIKAQIITENLNTRPKLHFTNTSKNSDIVQAGLELRLQKLVRKLKRDTINSGRSFISLTQEDRDLIKLDIKLSLEDAYIIGKKYTNRNRRVRKPLNQQDLQNIDIVTNQIFDRFINLIQGTELKVVEFGFDLLMKYLHTLISDAITKTVNSATLANVSPAFPTNLALNDQADVMVEFVTRRDEKVCQICEALDGQQYQLNDSSKPIIPDDTHPNCRCRYLQVINGITVSG